MQVTFKGSPIETNGNLPIVGKELPQFKLIDSDGKSFSNADLVDHVTVLSIVPNIDTSVCDAQSKAFHEKVSQLDGVQLATISVNTAEEFNNWCAANGIEMRTVPDSDRSFGKALGLYVPDKDIIARAVIVVDQDGKITYEQLVPEIAQEPDYDQAVEAAKEALVA